MLNFQSDARESELREAIVACGRACYRRGLMTANDGNISVRVGAERVLITASGVCKGRMSAEDLLLLDMTGAVVSPRAGRKPSSESPMHLEAYRQRADVRAVIHAHPVFATALTVADLPLPVDVLPEVLLTLGAVPTTRYATPSSLDDADAIRDLIRGHDALLLKQHGSLTVGKDLEMALVHLERIEHVAEVFWRAHMLGSVARIPQADQDRLEAMRRASKGI